MKDWFTIDTIDESTYIISEYRHWEETHSGGRKQKISDGKWLQGSRSMTIYAR